MRTIKFRAFDKVEKKMWYPTAISADGRNVALVNEFGIEKEDRQKDELMQYTGLKDSKNREIYESDILRYKHSKKGRVISWASCGTYCIGKFFLPSASGMESFNDKNPQLEYHEIIGNVFENPELLKGEKC